MYFGETSDDSGAVVLLELVKLAAVHNAGNHFPHIEGLLQVSGHNAAEFLGAEQWLLGFLAGDMDRGFLSVALLHLMKEQYI